MYKFTRPFLHVVAKLIIVIIVYVARILCEDIEKGIALPGLQRRRPTLYGNGPHPLLWTRSQAARGQITIRSLTNRLNCVTFIVYTQITNVATSNVTQRGRSHAAPQAAGWRPLVYNEEHASLQESFIQQRIPSRSSPISCYI